MSPRTGRRQFLQTMAATTAAGTSACSSESQPLPDATGGTSGSAAGGQLGASGGAAASSGGSVPGSGGMPPGAGGTQSPSGGTQSPSGGTNDGAGGQQPAASGGSSDPQGSGGQDDPPEEKPPQLSSPLGVALLGLGSYAGGRLAPALQLTQHCRLVGIVTGTPSKIPEWQEQYGIEDKNVYTYDTMDALIDNPDIHVVYVVTPNHVHAEFAIRAAKAKKHVWCEKPMALDAEQCQSMISACNENGVKLCIGYRLQHEPNTQTVISYASSKPFGAIQEVEALAGFPGFSNGNTDVWRLKKAPGGGALYDMGVYCINAARYATGEEPVRVMSASQWTERPELFSEVDEWTEFELEFPSGVVAHCRTSFGERIDSLQVTCETGSYHLAPMQAYEGVSGEASDGTQFDRSVENQQAAQMDDDALAIIEQRAVLVPGEEGMRDVRIVQAIVSCAETGQPVEL